MFLGLSLVTACGGDDAPTVDAPRSDGPTTPDGGIDADPATCTSFTFTMSGAEEVPPVDTPATGNGTVTMDTATNTLTYNITFTGLSAAETGAHIHGFADIGADGGVLFSLPAGSPKVGMVTFQENDQADLLAGLSYVNVHSGNNPGGEIRGQVDGGVPCP